MPKFKCDKCSKEYTGNFCPNCGDKKTKKDDELMTDMEIVADILEDTKETITKKVKLVSKTTIMGIILLLIAVILFFLGMYYKSAYYNDVNGGRSTNAYVPEDSYNYIINSNYFNGYMTLSGAFVISGVLVLISDKKKRD